MTMPLAMTVMEVMNASVIKVLMAMDSTALVNIGMIHFLNTVSVMFWVDINECSAGTDMCASNSTCTNTEGGYNCSCDTGYHGDGFMCNSEPHNLFSQQS